MNWNEFASFIPVLGVVFIGGVVLWGVRWLLFGRKKNLDKEKRFPRQVLILVFVLTYAVAVLISLPVSDATRTQLVTLLGIIVSALVAFSSTTVVSNLMAGILLRITKPFHIGDFIRVGEQFGRVSERGFFHTEIQSEYREFIALPNTLLIRSPVTTISGSGTIVSTSLSLGYDLHHAQIEPLLKQAATECGLEDPFVHITELGNYAITYRIAGFLSDVKGLITARSNLCRAVLDQLHGQQVEIVSPTFMNQRQLDPSGKVIPVVSQEASEEEARTAEEIVFDKAEQAAQYEEQRQKLVQGIEEQEAQLKTVSKEEAEPLKAAISGAREQLGRLEEQQKDLETEDKPADTTSETTQ